MQTADCWRPTKSSSFLRVEKKEGCDAGSTKWKMHFHLGLIDRNSNSAAGNKLSVSLKQCLKSQIFAAACFIYVCALVSVIKYVNRSSKSSGCFAMKIASPWWCNQRRVGRASWVSAGRSPSESPRRCFLSRRSPSTADRSPPSSPEETRLQ